MADHFLTKSLIDLAQCLPYAGGLALDRHGTLRAVLAARVSARAAALFAEPLISRGNDAAPASIAWYTDHAGEGRPLAELDDAAQTRARAILSEDLTALRQLLADPEDGLLLGAALHLGGSPQGDIWVVDGQPVIINWGMLPPGMARDTATRTGHFARTLGPVMSLSGAPPLTEDERQRRSDTVAAQTVSATVLTQAAAVPQPPMPTLAQAPDLQARRISAWEWVPLLLLLLMVGGGILWLLWPGNRLFPPAEVAVLDDARAAEMAAEVNAALEERRAALQLALAGAQCRADGTLLMPGGTTIEGLPPPRPGVPQDAPGQRTEADPTPVLPPDPARVQVPDRPPVGTGTTALEQTSLLAAIEARTVMVVARTATGTSTGSGFFVGPDLVMTNLHVIAAAEPGAVFVTNASLGSLHATQVLATQGPFEQTATDFALLRVTGVTARHYALHVSGTTLKLQSVIAAGYPGDVLETDAAFGALQAGNVGAVPDLTVTDGTVNTEQTVSPTSRAVVHSAPISQGNSGGPLVDMCGRVVGINTFARKGPMRTLNFALSADTVVNFLQGAGITPDVSPDTCTPQVLRPEAAVPAPTPSEAPAATPMLPNFGTPPAQVQP